MRLGPAYRGNPRSQSRISGASHLNRSADMQSYGVIERVRHQRETAVTCERVVASRITPADLDRGELGRPSGVGRLQSQD